MLYTIDGLIADLDEGTAGALKIIEEKMSTHRDGMIIKD